MSTHRDNKYSVNARLSELTSRVTALEAENKELRVHLAGQLETKINDAKHLIQASIRIPQDGKDGRDGRDSVVPGPRGDITVYGPEELKATVLELRRKLKEQHAKFIAVLLEYAQGQNKGNPYPGKHFANLLDNIRQEIERLQ
jgi:hypothetical protein